jgi:AraC-like DNA-binding protein
MQVGAAPHWVETDRGNDAFLGVGAELGAALDEVAFPASVKDVPVTGADPYLNELLIGYCEEALARRAKRAGPVRANVQNAIVPLLPHGRVSGSEIARKLGISKRTLARRLASESVTFGKVLDDLRHDLALRHIGDSDLSMSQIAWLLGYQEVSAFSHAFKRWTFRPPKVVRAQSMIER